MDQMKVDGFEFCDDPTKRRRGRPRKTLPKILDFDEEKIQTRSHGKSMGIMDDINSIFQAPSLTTSPKKKMKKVAISLLLSNFSAKDLDQFRTTNTQRRLTH
jgi:hypothetical protein